MCLPFIGILGAAVGAIGSIVQANQQAANAEAQSELNLKQASLERERGAFEVKRIDRRVSRVIGRQTTAFASSGIQIDSGSTIDVAADSLTEANIDKEAALFGARVRESNFRDQASINRADAKNKRTAGFIGAVTPFINAFSSGSSGTSFAGAFS